MTYFGAICFWGLAAEAKSNGVQRLNVPDASGEGTVLQVLRFQPDTAANTPRPAVLLFHGGSWRKGGPWQMAPYASEFADAGYVAYSAEYRLVGKNTDTVTDCVADAEAVYQWLVDHSEEQGIDPEQIFIGGASAGGHIALCVFLRKSSNGEPRFKGYIGYNPVVTTELDRFEPIFRDVGPSLNPMKQITEAAAPLLIFHGSRDPIVPIESVMDFQELAGKLGVHCRVEVFEGESHGFFNKNRASLEIRERLREEALAFIGCRVQSN